MKVKLVDWCDRWKHGNITDTDYFSIAGTEEKDASEEIVSLSMGRLVEIPEDDDWTISEDDADGEDIFDDDGDDEL